MGSFFLFAVGNHWVRSALRSAIKKKVSVSLTLSAAIMLLLASSLPLSSLLQTVQAQTAMNFRTPTPASGTMSNFPDLNAALTFDIHGTRLVNPEKLDASGTYKITSNRNGEILSSGSIVQVEGCCLTNDSSSGKPIRLIVGPIGSGILISTSCSTSATNHIDITNLASDDTGNFQGPVECSPQGGNATQQSSIAGSSQEHDGDGDGIPNANDNCPNLPHTRCFKEGNTAVVVHNNSNR